MLTTMPAPFPLLHRALVDAADPDRAPAMAAYLRNQFPFLGVSTPERRRVSREILRALPRTADWDFIAKCWAAPEREFQYVACDHLARVPVGTADLPALKQLVTRKSWWDSVDALVKTIGRAADPASMRAWAQDPDRWVRRAAILHQLGRKEHTDTSLLGEIILANTGATDFFINKAIGWALRDHARTDPEWVRGFLGEHADLLSPLSRREAGKHL